MTLPPQTPPPPPARPLRICLAGATGTIGRATAVALLAEGHDLVCLTRPGRAPAAQTAPGPAAATWRAADVTDPAALARDGFAGERFDAVISCLASRTGAPRDAWAIDHRAQLNLMEAAQAAGAAQFILLSAICVQKPLLAFQHAKLAAEAALIASGLRYSIVRPTAFFKSLCGQIDRVRQGRPFLIFGDGRLTACKPISDADLAAFITGCLHDPARWNRILPIGGPGPAITPRDQGQALAALLGRPVTFRAVPVALLDAIIAVLGLPATISPAWAERRELARIGRYYATESMLLRDPQTGRYDADATPETGQDTLFDAYRAILSGAPPPDRGEHAVF